MPERPDMDGGEGAEPHIFIILILLLIFFTFASYWVPPWARYLLWIGFLLIGTAMVRYSYGHFPPEANIVVTFLCLMLLAISIMIHLERTVLEQTAVALVIMFSMGAALLLFRRNIGEKTVDAEGRRVPEKGEEE